MPMKPLAGVFLALACILGIASTDVFELAMAIPISGWPPPVDPGPGSPRHGRDTLSRSACKPAEPLDRPGSGLFTIRYFCHPAVIPVLCPSRRTDCLRGSGLPCRPAQGSVFQAVPVDEANFILVSAPIGKGERSQLNIYEQRTSKRCFAVSGGVPPWWIRCSLSISPAFSRYIDGNGYSRIGGDGLGTATGSRL